MLFEFLICFIAGIGAGLGTGFAGMSAAAVISPMLITFLVFLLTGGRNCLAKLSSCKRSISLYLS